jgi:hypothetical protein
MTCPLAETVILEVLSDSTRRADLGEKRDAYLMLPSLKVLMFVEPEKPSGSLHRVKLPIIPTPAGAKPFELSGERLLELEMEAEGQNRGA